MIAVGAQSVARQKASHYSVIMLDGLIRRACDADKDVRKAARDELSQFVRGGRCTVDEAQRLIRAAVHECEVLAAAEDDKLPITLWAASEYARDLDPTRLLATVAEVFASLNPSGKLCALRIVVLSETPEAARLYVSLLREHGEEGSVGYFPTFDANAEIADSLFPALLGVMMNDQMAWDVLRMLLEFRQADALPPTVASGHEHALCSLLDRHLASVRRLQRPSGVGWRDEQPYGESRSLVGLLFDVAGFLSAPDLMRTICSAHDLLDPRLRRFRAVTIMRSGGIVADDELEWIAQSPRDRYGLFRQLVETGLAHRLPPACRDQALLAEGEMVDWLCFETELGREPDEIELIHVESRRMTVARKPVPFMKKRTSVDYYFFKYRVTEDHWARKDGWMVGMAGGFDRRKQPTLDSDGSTFSRFTSFESQSLAEHIAEYLD